MTLPADQEDIPFEVFEFVYDGTIVQRCIIACVEQAGGSYLCPCGRRYYARNYQKVDNKSMVQEFGDDPVYVNGVRWEIDVGGTIRPATKIMTMREIYDQFYKKEPTVFDEIGNFDDIPQAN